MRGIRFLTTCLACGLLLSAAARAEYPDRPIRLIVGFPPGQATDVIARLVAQKLQARWGQSVIVDNRAGAGGIIGTQEAAKAAADGYTLLVSSSGPLAVNPSLYPKIPYDSLRDFEPISELTVLPLFLAVNLDFPAKTVAELVQAARSRPGEINYGSAGSGVTSHLAMEQFKLSQQVDIRHIPYKGSVPAVTDLVAGQVSAMIDTGPALIPQAKAGKVRLLAVTSATRSPAAPDVPTMAELGLKDVDAVAWVGIVAPKGTPAAIVTRLHEALSDFWTSDEIKASLASLGGEAVVTSPQDFSRYLRSELAKWATVIKVSGARVD